MNAFDDSSKRIRTMIVEEKKTGVLQSSLLLSHGYQTEKTLLCFHGYTKSPNQFIELAYEIFKTGVNVWVPRLPHHGLDDKRSDEQQELSPSDLKSFVARNVDIIKGLGLKPTVLGISGGGVLAAWSASRYPGIDHTISLSPVLGLRNFPKSLYSLVPGLMRWLPNRFVWWEGEEGLVADESGYPKLSTKALGSFLELGVDLFQMRKEPLASPKLTMVLNQLDDKVDNEISAKTIEGWLKSEKNQIERIDFSDNDNLDHDIVSPEILGVKKDRVYKLYKELIHS